MTGVDLTRVDTLRLLLRRLRASGTRSSSSSAFTHADRRRRRLPRGTADRVRRPAHDRHAALEPQPGARPAARAEPPGVRRAVRPARTARVRLRDARRRAGPACCSRSATSTPRSTPSGGACPVVTSSRGRSPRTAPTARSRRRPGSGSSPARCSSSTRSDVFHPHYGSVDRVHVFVGRVDLTDADIECHEGRQIVFVRPRARAPPRPDHDRRPRRPGLPRLRRVLQAVRLTDGPGAEMGHLPHARRCPTSLA